MSGIDVVMVDVAEAAVLRGLATITGSLDRLVKKEKITVGGQGRGAASASTARPATTRWRLPISCIEAATENEELKFRILKQVDALARPDVDPRVEHVVDLDHQARRGDVAARRASSACTSSTRCR